jgi:hypothetical protein
VLNIVWKKREKIPQKIEKKKKKNCDYVQIFGAVIGHLEVEIDF